MRFGRKSRDDGDVVDEVDGDEDPRTGPFDADDLPDDGVERVDLGSLLIAPEEGRELRLQVDEASGQVQSVMLAGSDGALEIRAFAAPRNGDLWSEVRPQIAAEMSQRGGTAVQPSRIVGINGPRWLLRATLLGQPALEVDDDSAWLDSLEQVAVRRGVHALPVGEPLPLVLPDQARRVSPDQS